MTTLVLVFSSCNTDGNNNAIYTDITRTYIITNRSKPIITSTHSKLQTWPSILFWSNCKISCHQIHLYSSVNFKYSTTKNIISNKILFTKRGSGKRKILFLFLATWYLNGFMITFKPHWSFHMYLACVFSNVNEYINFLSDIPKYNHKIWLIPIPVKSKSKL